MSSDEASLAALEKPDTSLFGFYGPMSRNERRTFWACASGWAMDGMDFMIYPLVIGSIITLWGVSNTDAGFAATLTLMFSALGGWLAGILSDRIGRVLTLKITILWFSFFSVLCAFAQNFDQLLVYRALLGIGFGGEWAAGSVLIGEVVRAQYRGRAVGCVQASYCFGWAAAVIAQAVFYTYMPEESAWRWMFAMGGLPALLVFTLLNKVEEPPLAVKSRQAFREAGQKANFLDIFSRPYIARTVLAAIMLTGAQGGYYSMSIWLPQFLQTERGMTQVGSTFYLATLIVGAFVGFLFSAWAADIIGRKRMFWLSAIGAVTVTLTYTQATLPSGVMWFLGFPLGFFMTGFFAGFGPFLSELYPTHLRGSGQGFTYNMGRGIGSLFPTFVGMASVHVGLGNSITIFAVSAYTLFFLVSFTFPETKGKELD